MIFFVGLLYKKKGKNRSLYTVSVVVAARNEEKDIGRLLFDLTHQTYSQHKYEIVIADDGSHDKTGEIVKQYAEQFNNIKLVNVKHRTFNFSPKKYALKSAIDIASGEIILCTDADCRVGSRWIESMVSYFTDDVGFVIGFSQLGKKNQSYSLFEGIQAFDFFQLMAATAGSCNLGFPLAASGQNLGYRRKAYDQVDGYNQVSHRISGDDILLLQLIKRQTNYKIIFASDKASFVTSALESTLQVFINQRKRWASNGSYQMKLNPVFFGYLIIVWLFNALLFFGLPLSCFTSFGFTVLFTSVLLKLTAEFLIAVKSSIYFSRYDFIKYFPIWFVFEIPYVVIIGLLGSIGPFYWKERKHFATTRTDENRK
jgi:cellulose synthase/poly-beta-1,6-N-acetylglucosamine synthase-like glycosyltransferase